MFERTTALRVKLWLWMSAFALLFAHAVSALGDEVACRGLGNAMIKNSKTPYHSAGTISFDPKDPPAPGMTISGKPLPTESIFTGTQVFAKRADGKWQDIHAVIADMQQRVAHSVEGFTDCRQLPDEEIDGQPFSTYVGTQTSGETTIKTKVWVSRTGTLALSDTLIAGPTPPDGKIRRQLISLHYDYENVKAPPVGN